MDARTNEAIDRARDAASGPGDRFIESLVDRIGGRASVSAVFGEPIERDGLTVVPVARVRWAFGGGYGTGAPGRNAGFESEASGSGGGGGASAEPLGYLEIGKGEAIFKPIVAPYPSPIFLVAAAVAGAIVLRALARLIRG